MKKCTAPSHPINTAVLAAEPAYPYAALTADITPSNDGWVQLLPAGAFTARDGRPHDTDDGHWHLDAQSAHAFITTTKSIADRILVDYDHQTLTARDNSGPAPAAAWLASSDIEWRDGSNENGKKGEGIYIKPAWTAAAQQLINSKEYGFLSAVFPYDKTGRPLYLRMAAITNDPGVLGMEPLAALSAQPPRYKTSPQPPKESSVNDILKALLAKLDIAIPAAESSQTKQDAATGDNGDTPTLSQQQLDTLQTAALSAIDTLQSQVATLTSDNSTLTKDNNSLSKAYNGVTEQIAVLSGENTTGQVLGILSEAKAAGKIVAAEEDYLTNFGKQHGVAALSAMLDKRPAITALSAQQTQDLTNGTSTPPNSEHTTLSEEEIAVLSACGLDETTFLAHK